MMAGTDSTRPSTLGGPSIILIDPQLDENIGTVARAMLNCGLNDLRLVRPRENWLNDKTRASSCGADIVLDQARICATTQDAIHDLNHVYATTARGRDMVRWVFTPREAALEIRDYVHIEEKSGILFGPERAGLQNEDISLCDKLIRVPLNPAFCSLNLAQAVLLIGYEYYQASDQTEGKRLVRAGHKKAEKNLLLNYFQRLEFALDDAGFFKVEEKKELMLQKIRAVFERTELMEFEVHLLHGILTALTVAPHKPKC
ncbi:MAG: RNA methyltransferase [Alphaproteobacteria bacterium]|nr:RNA methyltransferase [Alphaproteobacteria bacterium]